MYWGKVSLNGKTINNFMAHNVEQLQIIAKGISERHFSDKLISNYNWKYIGKGKKSLKCVSDSNVEIYILEYGK